MIACPTCSSSNLSRVADLDDMTKEDAFQDGATPEMLYCGDCGSTCEPEEAADAGAQL